MTTPTETLIEQLADLKTRSAARVRLIQMGWPAVDELLSALNEDIELAHRKTIMRILLQLEDKRAQDLFRRSLNSDDEEIRAISATGLYKLGAEVALKACVSTINDAPDMLHYDITPSVLALAEMGIPALQYVLPLLDSADARTRQHAQRVFERVTFNEVSRLVNPLPLSNLATTEWTALWEKNGSYAWDAPETQRRVATEQWERWLNEYVPT